MDINLSEIIPLLVPVFLLQLGLQIYSLVNLAKRKKVRFGSKLLWAIVILLNLVGAIIYLVLNKGYEE